MSGQLKKVEIAERLEKRGDVGVGEKWCKEGDVGGSGVADGDRYLQGTRHGDEVRG